MFTGIVEGIGRAARHRAGEETRLRIEAAFLGSLERGSSVAVAGVCLTVADSGPGWFTAVASPETLSRTTLGGLAAGARVNLERPLRLGDRLGGHLVQGHVDGVGEVRAVAPEGTGSRVRIALPADLEDCVVLKGSIAVDGVSLTVAARGPGWFEAALIPATLQVTGMGGYRPGSRVNLEVDLLGRYVVEYLKRRGGSPPAAEVSRELVDRFRSGATGREAS
jgi:riboflavin synthase